MSHPYRQRSQTSMQGTRNESIPPNPKTRLPHDVNPHTCKACNVGFRVTEGKRQNFIPRTPGKVRLVEVQAPMAMCYFNPRTPGGVRPSNSSARTLIRSNFNPRTPGGVRRFAVEDNLTLWEFQSTHPGWGATLPIYSVKC